MPKLMTTANKTHIESGAESNGMCLGKVAKLENLIEKKNNNDRPSGLQVLLGGNLERASLYLAVICPL